MAYELDLNKSGRYLIELPISLFVHLNIDWSPLIHSR